MDRRTFIESLFAALAMGGISLLAGCGKKDSSPRLGNQDALWKMASTPQKIEEPVTLGYVKDTPAAYRDASMGKEDPNFKPKVGGG